jgi:hypothetical protein
MPSKLPANQIPLVPSSEDDAPMTAEQAVQLKQLARNAYEPEAFSQNLTRAEAQRRIAMLNAKLKLQDEPPHTL